MSLPSRLFAKKIKDAKSPARKAHKRRQKRKRLLRLAFAESCGALMERA